MARHRLEPKRSPSEALALAAENYGLLVVAVRKTIRDRHNIDDFLQTAWFDLYRAAELYDPDDGNTFGTYAFSCVRSRTMRAWRRSRCIGSVPDKVARVFRELERRGTNTTSGVEDALAQAFTGDSHGHWDARAFFTFSLGERSLSEVVGDAEHAHHETIEDTLTADGPTPDELAESALRSALAHRLLAAAPLTDRERMVVEARFFADPEETLQEIGDRIGICKERVRQIEAVALRKLRDAAAKIAR